MPSKRKQINVRVDEPTESLMGQLIDSVGAGLGMPVNQSDLFRLGLHELAKKYPPAEQLTQTPPRPSAPKSKERPRRK